MTERHYVSHPMAVGDGSKIECRAAVQMRPVEESLSCLRASIDELDVVVAALADRLQPVILGPQESEDKTGVPAQPMSDLERSIAMSRDRVAGITKRLGSVLNGLRI